MIRKLPSGVLRFILEFLWEIEDRYYLIDTKFSRYIYLKLKILIGYLEEEMYRRNMEYRVRK